jgi:hypothetical protein
MALPFFNAYRGSMGRFFQGDPTLVGYWQLDGSSVDNSGNGNNGTDTAMSYGPAYSRFSGGQGANFNGSSSYIRVEHSASLSMANAITIGAWVYFNDVSRQYAAITLKGSSTDWNWHFQLYNDLISWGTYTTAENNLQSTTIISPHTWYHVVVTYDGSTKTIYINGRLDSYNSVSGNFRSNTTPLGIGVFIDGANLSRYFNGYIDEVAIFSRALSAQEISQYYQWATSAQKKSWYGTAAILLSLSEAVTNTDTFLKGIYRSFTESITNSDTFAGIKVLFALFTEAVQSTDTLIKTIGKNLSETIQNTDTLIKTTIKNFRESITNSDTLNTLKFVMLNLFESVKSTASLWINGMFIDVWWTKRIKPIINWIKRNKPQ